MFIPIWAIIVIIYYVVYLNYRIDVLVKAIKDYVSEITGNTDLID
jgi:hypothetical protein